MSEEHPNACQSNAQDPEQSKKVGLSKIILKFSGLSATHSSRSVENV